ncbi:MAG: endo-1,4-beta-xylanase [Bacteroidota bacterium]|nr:endo-1,4-beta-xylanase [Bacteroidota bacterium]
MYKILFFLLIPIITISQEISEPSLKKHSEFPIGTSIRFVEFMKDKKLKKLQKHHFDSYTAGNDMKMYQIVTREGNYNWARVDSIINYTTLNNQRLFGHTLIWHSATPKWVEKKAMSNPQWLEKFMKEYITKYVGRYKGKVDGWDVVNEGLNTKGSGFREESIWYKTMGKKYIEKAFKYAHKADPKAILFYNDFNIERDTLKFNSMMKMIEDFLERDVPISGIGFQMHIRMDIPNEIIEYTLKRAASTGLQIHLSEVDIIFNSHDDSKGGGIQTYNNLTTEMLNEQLIKYEELVNIYKKTVPKSQQYGITLWGFNDRDTWINRFFKIKDWPCIYDEKLNPKPAFYGFLNGLKN